MFRCEILALFLQLVHSLEATYCTVRQIKKLLKAFILEECKAKNERVLNINTLVAVEPACGFGQVRRYYARPPLIAEAQTFQREEIMQLLIHAKANPDTPDSNGLSVADWQVSRAADL